jgi:hypothetical protein
MPVFETFGGQGARGAERTVRGDGTWPFDRTVLLSFPTREAALQMGQTRRNIKAIAVHRRAGHHEQRGDLDALPPMPPAEGASAERTPSPARSPEECGCAASRSSANPAATRWFFMASSSRAFVAAGMLLHIPFNSTLDMSVRILDVRLAARLRSAWCWIAKMRMGRISSKD